MRHETVYHHIRKQISVTSNASNFLELLLDNSPKPQMSVNGSVRCRCTHFKQSGVSEVVLDNGKG